MPLLNLAAQDAPSSSTQDDDEAPPKKGWYLYIPLGIAILFILMPQPSFLLMLSSHYLKSRYLPVRFTVHLLNVYAMTILALTSLTICAVRDPGSVIIPLRRKRTQITTNDGNEETEQALLSTFGDNDEAEDPLSPREIDDLWLKGLWCKTCRHIRPERAHHCSVCGRCILKMDHHCPWIGANCVGYRTYPAFMHFVFMCTMLSVYIAGIAVVVVVSLIQDPFSADPQVSPLHALFLALFGAVFTLVMGSFLVYHIYLVTTGQTTLEHISLYHLLRHLPPPASSPKPDGFPPPPSSSNSVHSRSTSLAEPPSPLSDCGSPIETLHLALPLRPLRIEESTSIPARYCPPEEHQLTHSQRRLVRYHHGRIRVYDLGWKRNWGEVFGGGRGRLPLWKWWLMIITRGGRSRGDGRHFEKTRGIEARLQKFSNELEEVGRAERIGHRTSH